MKNYYTIKKYIHQLGRVRCLAEALNEMENLIKFIRENNISYDQEILKDLIIEEKKLYFMISIIETKYNQIDSKTNGMKIYNDNIYLDFQGIFFEIYNENSEEQENFKYLDYSGNAYGKYLLELKKYPVLQQNTIISLFKIYHDISLPYEERLSARNKIIKHNQFLVKSIAEKKRSQCFDTIDLIEYGMIGLIIATDKFDENRGCTFSTYAIHWINQAILRALENNTNIVRIPARSYSNVYDYNTNELQEKKLSFSEYCQKKHMNSEILTDLINATSPMIQLEEINPDSDEENLPNCESIQSESNTENIILKKELKKDLYKAFEIARLNEKEKKVLELRFGLTGLEPMTLEQVGAVLKVTRERIRQIEHKALLKIKASLSIFSLGEYHNISKKKLKKAREDAILELTRKKK